MVPLLDSRCTVVPVNRAAPRPNPFRRASLLFAAAALCAPISVGLLGTDLHRSAAAAALPQTSVSFQYIPSDGEGRTLRPVDLNNNGWAVGDSDLPCHVLVFDPRTNTTEMLIDNHQTAIAIGLTQDDTLVGTLCQAGSRLMEAFVRDLSTGAMTRFPDPAGEGSWANDMNDAGVVVGGYGMSEATLQGWFWRRGDAKPTVVTAGPNLPSTILGVNAAGMAVGRGFGADGVQRLFLVDTNTGSVNWLTASGIDSNTRAAIDDRGDVVWNSAIEETSVWNVRSQSVKRLPAAFRVLSDPGTILVDKYESPRTNRFVFDIVADTYLPWPQVLPDHPANAEIVATMAPSGAVLFRAFSFEGPGYVWYPDGTTVELPPEPGFARSFPYAERGLRVGGVFDRQEGGIWMNQTYIATITLPAPPVDAPAPTVPPVVTPVVTPTFTG